MSPKRRVLRLQVGVGHSETDSNFFFSEVSVARRRVFRATYAASLGEVFAALALTLAFRRWPPGDELPQAGMRYRCQTGTVRRTGRVVDVIRPCGLTLEEVLDDPPCRVHLFLRWRIEPLGSGSEARLDVRYRLNHAAALRFLHWDRRLTAHFGRQLEFVGVNLQRLHDTAVARAAGGRP